MTHQRLTMLLLGLCLGALILAGIFSFRAWQTYQAERAFQSVASVAQQLGYSDERLIATYEHCWGELSDHCGRFLLFNTLLDKAQFSDLVARLGFDATLIGTRDGYTVFEEINLATSHQLTWNGNPGREHILAIPKPPGYEWRLTDRAGQVWVLAFYSLAQDDRFALDGARLQANVVTVMKQTR